MPTDKDKIRRSGAARAFKPMRAKHGGWSEWVYPDPKGYLMKCCDCGLVHELQFRAFVESNKKSGSFEVKELPLPIRAMFRARRAK